MGNEKISNGDVLVMGNRIEEVRKSLVRFSNRCINGKLLIKFSSGQIVYLEVSQQIFPERVNKPDKDGDIPTQMCWQLIKKLQSEIFFGEIMFNFDTGRLTGVVIKRLFRLDDLEKILAKTDYGKAPV